MRQSSQTRQSFRKQLRIRLSDKPLANDLADVLEAVQTQINAALTKLDADDTATLDVDYASLKFASIFDANEIKKGAAFKQRNRKVLRSALQNKKAADLLIDSIIALQTNFNALMDKLDAEAGTLASIDFASTLAVTEVNPDDKIASQHRSSWRRIMWHLMGNKKTGAQIVDTIYSAQLSLNALLAQLDIDAAGATGALTGLYVPFKKTVLDPDIAE